MTEKKNRNKKQSKAKTSSRVSKGNFGYFRSEKRRRLIITAILFAVPLFIFFTSWFYFKTRMTIWTVVTVVGCLPACKSMVNLIMILKCRPMDAGLYQKIHEHQGSLDMAYELYMTFYEKSAYIDAAAVCGNTVVAYSKKTTKRFKSSPGRFTTCRAIFVDFRGLSFPAKNQMEKEAVSRPGPA